MHSPGRRVHTWPQMATVIKLESRDVPPADRFDWWCEQVNSHLLPTAISCEQPDDFRASGTQLLLGEVHLPALQASTLRGADGDRLGRAAVELAAAYLAGLADTENLLPPRTRAAALRSQIKAFIGDHLGDPALSPPTVAAAQHISLRYLHRLFEQE